MSLKLCNEFSPTIHLSFIFPLKYEKVRCKRFHSSIVLLKTRVQRNRKLLIRYHV